MPFYECENCERIFDKKYNYDKHMKRKFPCIKIEVPQKNSDIEEVAPEEEKSPVTIHECPTCGKEFTRRDNMMRHKKNGLCKMLRDLHDKMDAQTQKINELEEKLKNPPPSHVTNNINNLTINMVSFGNEEFSKLSRPELLRIINSKYGAIRNYVETTHINDRLPEQQNVLISNLRSSECQVVENNRWVTKDVNEVIDEIIANGVNNIEKYLEEHDIHISQEKMDKLTDLLNKMQNLDNDDDEFVKKMKLEIKRLLYDNRKRIKTTRYMIDVI
jgi:hypothetical protein